MSKSAITGAAALKVPQFRSFLTARFFLTMSFQMQSVAVGWQVYNITHDPLALGMIGLAEAIPFLSLVLFAGHWADIYIRKKLISISVVLFVLCSATFLLFSVRPSLLPAVHPEYLFYLVFAFAGVARAIAGPSIQATLPQILKRELYANGAAWNSSFWQIAAVTGPALGGLIYGFAGQS
ncbi:MAG: MFS transporter, partial [Bacteroidetes bacterium]|nr:MFS transporter [Bacteroidota bacterium]